MWALKEGEVKTVKKDLKPNTTGLTPSTYQPHPQPLPASPPAPLQGERGVICLVH